MEDINQIPFNFDPRIGLIVGIMVGFLVFAVSLDLTWEKLRRVLKKPKAPTIGLVAQFGILPAIAFLTGLYLTDSPSIALGLLLVTCCPAGALSNYLTGVAKGDVATSISMTTISTLFSIVLTPLLFGFWASMNPSTQEVLQNISMDPQRVIMTLQIMLIIPVTAGMLLRAKRPVIVDRIRRAVRLVAGIVFAVIVAMIIGSNFKSLALLAQTALFPVLFTFVVAVGLGWGIGWLAGLMAGERRAVAIEVAFQNVALAIGLGVTFFPTLGGIVAVSILWGIVHLTLGFGLAIAWNHIKIE
ncbi:bile acid:sodium symporter family protein [Arenibacter sp. F26102]|uniref:bile acid:sodium symporter family protein n=1 Tax=Arenibacter sp. F26102 TaxID=2926416 RepID=UPI001FF3B305|nr:bile acid:sodium symporter family protein [Arenibacter sp. F26102]MCK0147261.1 bile acid:sodium symporter family protein [Arenibacter sp. F26102]